MVVVAELHDPRRNVFQNTDYYWRVKTKDAPGLITTPTSGFKLRAANGQMGYDGFGGYMAGVNTVIGNMVFTDTDAKINTTGPALEMTRTYNTFDAANGPFGQGWSSPYFLRYTTATNTTVRYPDGRVGVHQPDGSTIGASLQSDSWTASNGTAWDSSKWTTSTAGTGGTIDVQSNAGRMTVNNAGGKARAVGSTATQHTDAEILTKVKFDTNNSGVFALAWLRGGTTWNTTDPEVLQNGYFVWIQSSGALSISKMVNDVETNLAQTTFTQTTGTYYSLRFQAVGTNLKAKIWPFGTLEPTAWNMSVTDSSLTSGRASLSATGGIAATITFDEFNLATQVGAIDDKWTTPAGYINNLSGNNSSTKAITMADGTVYTFNPTSNPNGYVTSITDPQGRTLNIDYSTIGTDGKIKLNDVASGRQIRLNTTGGTTNFRVTSAEMNNPAGGNYTWNYTYDTSGATPRLTKVCDARGASYCRQYRWDVNGRLDKVTDGNGQTDLELTFGTTGRVVTAKNGSGNLKKFQYSQQTSTPFEITGKMLDERFADNGPNWTNKSFQQIYSAGGELTKEYAPGVATATTYTTDAVTDMRTGVIDANSLTASAVYDSKLRVIKQTNGAGDAMYFAYDDAGNRVKECDGRSADTTPADNVPDADTYCTISSYGSTAAERAQRLIRSKQAPGLTAQTWTYTDGTESAYGGGGTMPAGLIKTTTDVLGRVFSYEYTVAGDLGKATDTGGGDTRYTYDSIGRMLTASSYSTAYPSGVTNTFTYDTVGNVLTETGPAITNVVTSTTHQLRVTNTYDANKNLTQTVSSDLVGGDASRTTQATFDVMDRQITATDALGNGTERKYDTAGNIVAVKDQLGRWMRTTYNDRNLPTKVEMLGVVADPIAAGPGTTVSQTEYDNASRVTATIDALGNRTETSYDNANRVSTIVTKNYQLDPGVSATRDILVAKNTYDNAGHILTVKQGGPANASAPLRTTTNTYDNAGRLATSTLSGVSRTTTYTRNAADQILTQTTTQSGVQTGGIGTAETRNTYNSMGLLTSTTVENGTNDLVTTFGYDSRGLQTSMVPARGNAAGADPNTFKIQNLYDELGRPYRAVSPTVYAETSGGAPTNVAPQIDTGYDTFGDATDRKDERGFTTITAYDKLSRKSTITYPTYTPSGGSPITPNESYAYDAVGNLTGHTDRRGYTTNFEYDIFNRVTKQKDPAIGANPRGEIVNTYNDPINLFATVDQTGARTEFGYDTRNMLRFNKQVVRNVTVTPQTGAPGPQSATTVTGGNKITYFEYDDLGRQTKTTTPELVTSTTTYNAADEATQVTDTAGKTVTSTFDAVGNPVRVSDQLGRQTRYEYDQAGRAVSQAAWASDAAGSFTTKSTATYDADNNVIASTSGRGNTTTMSYDALGRLAQVSQPKDGFVNLTSTYGYDAAGNLTRQRDPRGNATAPVAEDDFAGNNNAAWASTWTTGANSGGAVDIQGGVSTLSGGSGHLKATTGTGWARALGDATTVNGDAEVVSAVRTAGSVGNGEVKFWLRGSTSWAANNHNLTNGYAVSLDMGANQLRVKKLSSSTETTLSSSAFTFNANTTYRVRFQAFGSTLRARVWADGTTEPSTWQISTTDSTHTSGRAAISLAASATREVYLDEYYVQPLGTAGVSSPTRTLVGRTTSNNASATISTATSTSGELFVVLATYAGAGSPNLGISDTQSLTWTERATNTYTNGNKSMVSIFTATANGTNTNITVNAGSGSTYVISMEIYRYANHGGVGTAVSGAGDVGSGSAASVNLTVTPTTNANAETLAVIGFHEYASTPLTAGSGWTELYQAAIAHSSGNGYGGSAGVSDRHQSQAKAGAVSSTGWSWSTGDEYSESYAAVEILPAATTRPTRTLVARTTSNNASATVSNAPSASGELFVVLATYAGAGSPNLGISDTQSLTWTERATNTYTNGNKSMVSIFTATTNGANTDITVNAGSGSTYVISMEVYRYANHGGVGTAVSGAGDVGTGGSASVNLTVTPTTNANAETLAVIGYHEYATTALSPAAGWTELYEAATAHSTGSGLGGTAGVTIRHQSQSKTGAVSSAGWSWTSGDEYSESYAAVEILPSNNPPAPPASTAYDVITTYNPWNLPDTIVEPSTAAHPSATDRTWTSIYDAGGLMTQDKQPGAITITNTYDELSRLTGQSTGAISKSFGYDLASRKTTFSHPSGTQTLVYDDRTLPVGAAGPAGNVIATYNGDSQMLTRNDPAGNHSFGYDNRGRLTSAADPLSAKTFNYTLNDAGQTTRVDYGTAGGSTPYRLYTYDAIGRLATDTSKTGGGTTKQSSTYTYDADNNVTQQVLSIPGAGNTAEGTYDYTYDRADRLTRFDRNSSSVTTTDYRWDPAGNRTAVVTNGTVQSWTYDARNRITQGPEGTYTWDPRGTLDKIMNGATTVNDATYDNFGRMTAMAVSGSTINYTYDALDRIATRNVGTNQTFAYNGASIDPSLAAGIKYSRSPGERLLGVQNGATTRLAGINRHGDLQFMIDTSGNATDTNVYDPFGKAIQTTGSTGQQVGFQSDYTDPTSTDVWMGARWYAPATATFRSRDVIRGELSAPMSLNRYTYATGNPINAFDPDGRWAMQGCLGIDVMGCYYQWQRGDNWNICPGDEIGIQCYGPSRGAILGDDAYGMVLYTPDGDCSGMRARQDQTLVGIMCRQDWCNVEGALLNEQGFCVGEPAPAPTPDPPSEGASPEGGNQGSTGGGANPVGDAPMPDPCAEGWFDCPAPTAPPPPECADYSCNNSVFTPPPATTTGSPPSTVPPEVFGPPAPPPPTKPGEPTIGKPPSGISYVDLCEKWQRNLLFPGVSSFLGAFDDSDWRCGVLDRSVTIYADSPEWLDWYNNGDMFMELYEALTEGWRKLVGIEVRSTGRARVTRDSLRAVAGRNTKLGTTYQIEFEIEECGEIGEGAIATSECVSQWDRVARFIQ